MKGRICDLLKYGQDSQHIIVTYEVNLMFYLMNLGDSIQW